LGLRYRLLAIYDLGVIGEIWVAKIIYSAHLLAGMLLSIWSPCGFYFWFRLERALQFAKCLPQKVTLRLGPRNGLGKLLIERIVRRLGRRFNRLRRSRRHMGTGKAGQSGTAFV
jgi:hypothetical protein